MRIWKGNFVLFGTIAAALLISILGAGAWKALMRREAAETGRAIVSRLFRTIGRVHAAVDETVTIARYRRWEHAELVNLSDEDRSVLIALQSRVRELTGAPQAVLTAYTDCPASDPADCFIDFDPLGRDTREFQPKSRPWFLVTRSHSDWVFLNFLRHRATRRAGYPPEYGWALSRRIVRDESSVAGEGPDHGVWINFVFADAAAPGEHPLLKMGWQGDAAAFEEFGAELRALRVEPEGFSAGTAESVACDAVINGAPFLFSYQARVHCDVDVETADFTFAKDYDRPWLVIALNALALGLVAAAHSMLSRLRDIQRQSRRHRLEAEKTRAAALVGTQLIHDFKKGILSQLNVLPQHYGDLEEAALAPDFEVRLKSDLDRHFRYLRLLNKHVQLLQNNLKRAKEKRWVRFDEKLAREYVGWLVPDATVEPIHDLACDAVAMICADGETAARFRVGVSTGNAGFYVPEMGFYRVLQNLWENYGAYGTGEFRVVIARADGILELRSENAVSDRPRNADATGLGLVISRQILEDNFGADRIALKTAVADGRFRVTARFPLIASSDEEKEWDIS